jgi:hypothetical protein
MIWDRRAAGGASLAAPLAGLPTPVGKLREMLDSG